MSDTLRTEAAWDAAMRSANDGQDVADAIKEHSRQLERELTAAQAEIARLRAGGCARDQRTTQFCGEAVKLQEENARLQERIRTLENERDAEKERADGNLDAFQKMLALKDLARGGLGLCLQKRDDWKRCAELLHSTHIPDNAAGEKMFRELEAKEAQ